VRKAASSGVVWRPRAALRWGKRPKRAVMSRCRRAARRHFGVGVQSADQVHAVLLIGQRLAVPQGQVEEPALHLGKHPDKIFVGRIEGGFDLPGHILDS
jgi:hypothetical protein